MLLASNSIPSLDRIDSSKREIEREGERGATLTFLILAIAKVS